MATSSYAQLQKQIAALQGEADALRTEEVAGVVAKIKEAIGTYALQPEDLFGRGASARKARGASSGSGTSKSQSGATVKYADGKGGTWVGRGPRPLWLREALAAGNDLARYAIGTAAPAPTSLPVTAAAPAPTIKQGAKKAAAKKSGLKRATKASYKDDTGRTWSGIGPRPAWIKDALSAGKSLEDMEA